MSEILKPYAQSEHVQPRKRQKISQDEEYLPRRQVSVVKSEIKRESDHSSSYTRQKYNMVSEETKEAAVRYAEETGNIRAAAIQFNVKPKSLKRWIRVGHIRKKGGGRKTKDPKMEEKVHKWYHEQVKAGIPVTAKMIKNKAVELRSSEDF